MFRKLLIVGFALFTAACVPITPEASVPEVDIATPQPPSPRADLNDLASVLAKVDESDDSDKHAAILQKFADCFLSGMTAREREEGLSDNPGNAITPAQITALTLFQAGVFAAIGQYEQLHAVEQADSFPNMTSMVTTQPRLGSCLKRNGHRLKRPIMTAGKRESFIYTP